MDVKRLFYRDIIHKEYCELDSNIQRKFEWKSSKVNRFCTMIYDGAVQYDNSPMLAECKSEMGYLSRFLMPAEEAPHKHKRCYYIDDAGHRLIMTGLTVKAIYDIARDYDNTIDGNEILSQSLKVSLESVINDIKENFIPRKDIGVFSYIMNIPNNTETKYKTYTLFKAYEMVKEFFINVLEENVLDFQKVGRFVIEDLSFISVDYPSTSLAIRLEKYHNINETVQSQEILHRTLSTLSEIAAKVGYDSFATDVNACREQTNTYGLNYDALMKIYIYTKCGRYSKTQTNNISEIATFMSNEHEVNKEFFENFFKDYHLFLSLRNKEVRCSFIDSFDNRILSLLVANLVELFTVNGSPRVSTSTYFMDILTQCFVISNNCFVTDVKKHIDKRLLIEILSYILIYKFCVTAKCDGQAWSDDRHVFYRLMKDGKTLNNDTLKRHLQKLREVTKQTISCNAYNHLTDRGLFYNTKGCRFACCLIAVNPNAPIDVQCMEASRMFLNWNEYDIDHIIPQSMGGTKHFSNLRLSLKRDNRKDNTFIDNSRYINENDYSFPQTMRGKYFTEDDLSERDTYCVQRFHNFFKYFIEKYGLDLEDKVAI